MLPYKTSHSGLSVDSLPPLTGPLFAPDETLCRNHPWQGISAHWNLTIHQPCEFHITFDILGFS